MNWQNNLAMKLLVISYRGYAGFSHLINSCVVWSPFLIRVFDGIRRVVKLRVWKFIVYVLSNPTNIEGHVMFHNRDQGLIAHLRLGLYEPEVKKTVIQHLKPGMTMIDAGANIGYYTLLAARSVGPHGHVYAFEPVPSTVELLRKNIEANGYSDRVTIVPKAVTNKSSRIRIFKDLNSMGSSSMFAGGHETDFVEIESVGLDEFFSKQAWPPIHVIKMDIEGAEKLALDGMRELSNRNPELKLIVEVNLQYNVEELGKALQTCGFSRFYLLEDDSRIINTLNDITNIPRGGVVNLLCEKAD